jgi:hypothetical protein
MEKLLMIKKLKFMTSVICVLLMKPAYFSVYSLAKPSLSKEIFAVVV